MKFNFFRLFFLLTYTHFHTFFRYPIDLVFKTNEIAHMLNDINTIVRNIFSMHLKSISKSFKQWVHFKQIRKKNRVIIYNYDICTYNLKVKVRTSSSLSFWSTKIYSFRICHGGIQLILCWSRYLKSYYYTFKLVLITIGRIIKYSLRNLNFQNMNNNFRSEISPNTYQYLKLFGPLD